MEIENLLKKFETKNMNEWNNVNADLVITDPPFGIGFSGKNENYRRNAEYIVDGYVEWSVLYLNMKKRFNSCWKLLREI